MKPFNCEHPLEHKIWSQLQPVFALPLTVYGLRLLEIFWSEKVSKFGNLRANLVESLV